jgi:hypothetical protein
MHQTARFPFDYIARMPKIPAHRVPKYSIPGYKKFIRTTRASLTSIFRHVMIIAG